MRIVTEDIVALTNARYYVGALGYFIAKSECPICDETREVTFSLSELGQNQAVDVNCDHGHHWRATATIIR